jgi:hypothetical protein
MLMGFAFLTGLGLGPLLDMAVRINPTIVPSALLLTTAVFASFTGTPACLFARWYAVLRNRNRRYLFVVAEPE